MTARHPLQFVPAEEFKARTRAATDDAHLRQSFRSAMDFLMAKRAAQFPDDSALQRQRETAEATSLMRELTAREPVHGRGASEADIRLFAAAMTDNLMKRYGEALVNIEGKPRIRLKSETPLPGNRGVRVSTEVLREGGNPIPVDYLMRDNGGWKVFDVMVEGVSYVQTYRSQFDAPLRQKSIAQVAADLRAGTLQPQQP